MLHRILLVGLARVWLAEGLLAEESGVLAVGSRIRVTSQDTAGQPLIGQVVALEPGAVVILGEDGRSQTRVPLGPATTLEVSRGKRSEAGRGAMLGAAVGIMPGLFMTFGDYNTEKGNPEVVSLVGAAAGAAIGALICAAQKSEAWLPAEVPVVTAGIAPIPRGASISISVMWGRGHR